MERLTKRTIGVFQYDLKNNQHTEKAFNGYDAFFAYSNAVKRLGELEDAHEPKPIEEWKEEYGDCLWWSFPIVEPPYCSSPLAIDFPDHVTHFTRLVLPTEPKLFSDACQVCGEAVKSIYVNSNTGKAGHKRCV